MRTIVIANQKGGVGRTTVTMQLAAGLSCRLRVLVVDMDPQQSTRWWARDAHSRLPFTLAGAQSAGVLQRLGRVGVGFDVALVDTPAGTNVRAVDAALDAADFVVVPLIPEPLAVEPTMRTIHQAIEPRHVPFSVLLNKIDPRRPQLLRVWERRLDTDWGYPRFEHPLTARLSHLEAPLFSECATTPSTRTGHAAAAADVAFLSDAVHELVAASTFRCSW